MELKFVCIVQQGVVTNSYCLSYLDIFWQNDKDNMYIVQWLCIYHLEDLKDFIC